MTKKKKPVKPKPAPNRIIREGSMTLCPVCGSTYVIKYKSYWFGIKKIQGCLQPECALYLKEK